MKQTTRHIILLLTCSLLLAVTVAAQRISFGLYAAEGIALARLNDLNFNLKQAVILADDIVTVNLDDVKYDAVGILTVEGQKDLDITVTIDAPMTLDLESNHIPLAVKFAYSNSGASDEATAKLRAIEIPAGFTSATFPISRRLSLLPAPPPTPNYAGYSVPKGTVYLFVYGTMGPVPSNAAAGLYTGNINIRVEYAK